MKWVVFSKDKNSMHWFSFDNEEEAKTRLAFEKAAKREATMDSLQPEESMYWLSWCYVDTAGSFNVNGFARKDELEARLKELTDATRKIK